MKMRTQWLIPLAVPFLVSACGASTPDEQIEEVSYKNLHALHHDLRQGATGEAVRELHSYLARFGYFPNEKLAREYPAWRPVVETPPTEATVYDRQTEEAVRRLQKQYALPVTGIVDEATRAALKMPRCGTPDGIVLMDPSNKFSLDGPVGYGIPNPSATYAFYGGAWGDRMAAAINSWTAVTNQTIVPSSNPNLNMFFATLDSDTLADTSYTSNGVKIRFNNAVPWYTGASPVVPAETYDFQSVALHELGHALGLGHSGFAGTAMFPALLYQNAVRNLDVDDKVGVSLRRDAQTIIYGYQPEDIGVGIVEGSVWIINGPDHSMWKWDGGSGFVRGVGGGDARAIAVGKDGTPYVAAPWGVYRRTSPDPYQGTWQMINGSCALDVGVGTEPDPAHQGQIKDAVWMVDCNNNIHKWDGLWWQLDLSFPQHAAARIAVDRDGLPWVLSTDGVVYRRQSIDPTSSYYIDLPALLPRHVDIGVGPCCYAWGTQAFGGTVTPFQYQPGGFKDETGYWRWLSTSYAGTKISVGPNGEPWYFDDLGRIWHSTR